MANDASLNLNLNQKSIVEFDAKHKDKIKKNRKFIELKEKEKISIGLIAHMPKKFKALIQLLIDTPFDRLQLIAITCLKKNPLDTSQQKIISTLLKSFKNGFNSCNTKISRKFRHLKKK